MDKDVVCVHTCTHTLGYYSAIKKNETVPFAATWMDLEIIILSEASYTKMNIMISLICEVKIIQMNLYMKQEQTH